MTALNPEEWLPLGADGGVAGAIGSAAQAVSGAIGAGVGAIGAGVAAVAGAVAPRLEKATVAGPTTQNNGGYSWGVRWSLRNATASTNGWIIQKLVVRQNVQAGVSIFGTDFSYPITPGQGGYGGFPASWTPYWEGWEVRGGSIFVGSSASPHSADTFQQGPVGSRTKGTTEEIGEADFYPNLVLPPSFQVKNAPPAMSLPMTTSDPGLTGGTGMLDHKITASWDSVGGTGATTVATI